MDISLAGGALRPAHLGRHDSARISETLQSADGTFPICSLTRFAMGIVGDWEVFPLCSVEQSTEDHDSCFSAASRSFLRGQRCT